MICTPIQTSKKAESLMMTVIMPHIGAKNLINSWILVVRISFPIHVCSGVGGGTVLYIYVSFTQTHKERPLSVELFDYRLVSIQA